MDDGKEDHDKKRSPPVKVLSSQLREGKKFSVSRGNIECIIKRLGHAKDMTVSTVWMQGTVLRVNPDSVILLDETGTFLVNGVNNIPKGEPLLCEGKYVMVMGVIQALSPEPVLRAVKMANLSGHAEIHRSMWRFEVEDLQNLLRPT